MRILLLNVPIRLEQKPAAFPTGLGILAAVMKNTDHEVDVLDANALRIDMAQVIEEVRRRAPDLVGISGLVSTYKYQLELVEKLKRALPGTAVVCGGGCATSIPGLMLERSHTDFVVIGEGEKTLPELAAALERGDPPESVLGVGLRSKTGVALTEPRPLIEDLDTLPLPAYDLFPMDIYAANQIWNQPTPSMNILSSRGCPMDCNFCYNLFGRRSYRKRGPEAIRSEVQLLKREYGIAFVAFVDDNVTITRSHLENVCGVMESEGVPWGCHGRVDTLDEARLELMARSGCTWLGFGVESASPKILENMNKRATPEAAAQAIEKTRKYGIFPNTTFIIGYPGETLETIRETARFKIANKTVIKDFFATPYPGTELWNRAKELGRIPNEHEYLLSLNNAGDLTVNLTEFSDDELTWLRRQSHAEVIAGIAFKENPPHRLAPEVTKKLLELADGLLSRTQDILPEIKGIALRWLASFYELNHKPEMAQRCRIASQAFPRMGN